MAGRGAFWRGRTSRRANGRLSPTETGNGWWRRFAGPDRAGVQLIGLPTGWTAAWTNRQGGPTIAPGSDIDGTPKASQNPGAPRHDPMVPGAPWMGRSALDAVELM